MFCKYCNEEKEEGCFYSSDKYKCKECLIKYAANWRRENPDKYAINYENWYRRNGRTASQEQVKKNAEWNRKNREKVKASQALRGAVKSGKLIKPKNCECCNKEKRLGGHHEDYSKPYDVIWACGSCHKKIHNSKTLDRATIK